MAKIKPSPAAVRDYVTEQRRGAEKSAQELSARALSGDTLADDDIDLLDAAIEDSIRFAKYEDDLKVTVKQEPSTYYRGGPNSFVVDIIAAGGQVGAMGGAPAAGVAGLLSGVDPEAAKRRLQRHREEQRYLKEHANRDAERSLSKLGVSSRSASGALADGEGRIVEQRTGDLDALTSGSGAQFSPPAWFNQYAAGAAYSAGALRSLVRPRPLPDGTMLLNAPRFDTAVDPVLPQDPENSDVAESMGTTTDSVQAHVIELAGRSAVSIQLLERGGSSVDEAFLEQFQLAWASGIENQLINGGGGLYAFNGLTNLSNLVSVTYTSASPTGPGVVGAVAKAVAGVGNARKLPADAVLMRPGRWAWLNQAEDLEDEPVIRPGTGSIPADGAAGPYGPVGGAAVYQTGSIPSDLGVGTNQDAIYAVRSSDFLLFETVPTFDVRPDVQGYGSQLSVSLIYRGYAAAFLNRYTSAAQVSGTGLVVASGF